MGAWVDPRIDLDATAKRSSPAPTDNRIPVDHPIFTEHARLVRFRQYHLTLTLALRTIDGKGREISQGSAYVINTFLRANIRSQTTYIAYIYRHGDYEK
jgi:hypothetical protein